MKGNVKHIPLSIENRNGNLLLTSWDGWKGFHVCVLHCITGGNLGNLQTAAEKKETCSSAFKRNYMCTLFSEVISNTYLMRSKAVTSVPHASTNWQKYNDDQNNTMKNIINY